MKYFVAHLLSGDAAEYHRAVTGELSERFKNTPLHEKVAPHITIKIPFEANAYEVVALEEALARFAASRKPEPVRLEGFGRFGFRTVYLDVVKSHGAVTMVRDCVAELNRFAWMQRVDHEGNKLHASVARFLTYKKFRKVWRHLKDERPSFTGTLDTFTMLKKEEGARIWQVHRTFTLAPHPAPRSAPRYAYGFTAPASPQVTAHAALSRS